MRFYRYAVIAAIAAIAVASSAQPAAAQYLGIAGKVLNADTNQPYPGVTVRFTSRDTDIENVSDGNGSYGFGALNPPDLADKFTITSSYQGSDCVFAYTLPTTLLYGGNYAMNVLCRPPRTPLSAAAPSKTATPNAKPTKK